MQLQNKLYFRIILRRNSDHLSCLHIFLETNNYVNHTVYQTTCLKTSPASISAIPSTYDRLLLSYFERTYGPAKLNNLQVNVTLTQSLRATGTFTFVVNPAYIFNSTAKSFSNAIYQSCSHDDLPCLYDHVSSALYTRGNFACGCNGKYVVGYTQT